MDKKAVDVVLLPDEMMMDRAIAANRELVKKTGEKIVLDKERCLPHISLAMGCVDENDITAVGVVLKEIAEKTPLTELRVIGIKTSTNSVGEKVSVFEVGKTSKLQSLHEEAMENLAPYLSYDVTADMLYNPAEVGQSTLLWIKNYRAKSGFENFFPHITIGYGEINDLSFPIKFSASRLALCHLGSHCTCRKILASTEIATRP
ncbi:MAG: 2'-5' RNA ligase family protein [Planctomycetota bacterium]|jgi:2'-5' RNA ligase